MKNIDNEIREIVETFFDKKIRNARISEETKDKIWEMVDNLVEDVQDITHETERDIDYAIEEETAEYNTSYSEELNNNLAFREQELLDVSRDNVLTR